MLKENRDVGRVIEIEEAVVGISRRLGSACVIEEAVLHDAIANPAHRDAGIAVFAEEIVF